MCRSAGAAGLGRDVGVVALRGRAGVAPLARACTAASRRQHAFPGFLVGAGVVLGVAAAGADLAGHGVGVDQLVGT